MADDDKPLDPEIEAYVFALLSGGLYAPASVSDEPEVIISAWEIMAVNGAWGKTHHVVGLADGVGRVSSPIEAFDPAAKTVTTRSNRIYHLDDAPAHMSEIRDIEYVRAAWLRRNNVTGDDYADASSAYRKAIMEREHG